VARLCGACCGLLVFSATILAGLFAGNPIEKIMLRSIAGLAGGFVLGCVAAWIAIVVFQEQQADANEPTPLAASSESHNGNGRLNGRPREPENGRS
jgi:MFS family permease